jgi:hypothetical protein
VGWQSTRRLLRTVMFAQLVACRSGSHEPDVAAGSGSAKPAPPPMPALAGLFAPCKPGQPARTLSTVEAKQLPFAIEDCPTMPAAFGSLAFGMNIDAAKAAVKGLQIYDGLGFLSGGTSGVAFKFGKTTHTLISLEFTIQPAGLVALTTAWGRPHTGRGIGTAWFNADRRIAVYARPAMNGTAELSVEYAPYTPVAAMFGDALLGKHLIGKSHAELAALLPDAKGVAGDHFINDDPGLALLGNELEPATSLHLVWNGDRVSSYEFDIPWYGDDKLRAEVLAQITTSLGAPIMTVDRNRSLEPVDPELRPTWVYTFGHPGERWVTVGPDYGTDWQVEVTAD